MEFITDMIVTLLLVITVINGEEPMCPDSNYALVERILHLEQGLKDNTEQLENLNRKYQSNTLSSHSPIPYMTAPLTVDELEVNGWTLIFLARAGNGMSVYDAWIKGDGTTDQKPRTLERSLSSHYRDPGISNWSNFNIKYVKLALYEGRTEVAYVIFNGVGSTFVNWFGASNVVASSWSGVTSSGQYNHFSIEGHGVLNRRFHINKSYGGCSKDAGYLVVSDKSTNGCQWDIHLTYPQFLYSKINNADNWERLMVGRADVLSVLVYV